jgi:hypothetical protein
LSLQVQGGKVEAHSASEAELKVARAALVGSAACIERWRRQDDQKQREAAAAAAEAASDAKAKDGAGGDEDSAESKGDAKAAVEEEYESWKAYSKSGAGKGSSGGGGNGKGKDAPIPFLYARVDLLSSNDGKDLMVSEMEILDPELFFRLSKTTIARMVDAVEKRLKPLRAARGLSGGGAGAESKSGRKS